MSVHWSVGPSVHWSVRRSVGQAFVKISFPRFLSITAPAQPYTTDGHVSNRHTDIWTDRRTDTPTYTDARTHLKGPIHHISNAKATESSITMPDTLPDISRVGWAGAVMLKKSTRKISADGPMGRPTDRPSYRVAWTRLKINRRFVSGIYG